MDHRRPEHEVPVIALSCADLRSWALLPEHHHLDVRSHTAPKKLWELKLTSGSRDTLRFTITPKSPP